MRTSTRSVVLLAAVVVLTTAPALRAEISPEPVDLGDQKRQKLDDGEILVDVEQEGALHTDVIAVVDAPIDEVWEAIDDYNTQKEWVPDMMSNSKLLERHDDYKICRSGNDLPWPIANRVYNLKVRNSQKKVDGVDSYVSVYEFVEGSGNIEEMDGYWLLQPFEGDDDRTLVRQYTKIDLGISVPQSFIRSGTQKRLPGLIKGLRDYLARH